MADSLNQALDGLIAGAITGQMQLMDPMNKSKEKIIDSVAISITTSAEKGRSEVLNEIADRIIMLRQQQAALPDDQKGGITTMIEMEEKRWAKLAGV